tara:strand:- start:12 stop:647 length:636 start_codon:yes stop_codon:yes gene_type:complete
MSELGTKKFLEEQAAMSVGTLAVPLEDEDWYNWSSQSASSAQRASNMFSQSATPSLTRHSIADPTRSSTPYKPEYRGSEGDQPEPGEYQGHYFDPENDSTFAVTMDEYMEWWENWYMPNIGEMYHVMFLLSGKNSISGLSGMLGMPVSGDPETDAQNFLAFMQLMNMQQPEWVDSGEVDPDTGEPIMINVGGYCWQCFPEGDGDGGWPPGP